MFRRFDHRAGHYLLLLIVTAGLCLPNLGAASLWDIDEGNNAEAAREMMENENWVVPQFNNDLRTDKPALLYWLQILGYQWLGINEFSARLPSALAALAAVFVTYELGRRLFGRSTALLAGLVLASSVAFCASAHFANPDALLNLCTVLSFFLFWDSYARGGRGWFVPFGIATGLGMLAKGPVGFILPLLAITLFLLWMRQLRRLWDYRYLLGVVAFGVVMAPWYALVGVETKGVFLKGFFLEHNVQRFSDTMERHGGPILYYVPILILGLLPWSAFCGLTVWYALGRRAREDGELAAQGDRQATRGGDARSGMLSRWFPHLDRIVRPWVDRGRALLRSLLTLPASYRFLWCWILVYFVPFSLSGTKLPNYILPLYPAVALLTARFLDRWRRGLIQPPTWAMYVSLASLVLMGAGTTAGLLVASGTIPVAALRNRSLPGLEQWAVLGAIPIAGAAAAWWCLRQQRRGALVAVFVATAILFLGGVASWGSVTLNAFKAPEPLVQACRAVQQEDEIRVGCYQYFQPSLVFYCQRHVHRLEHEAQVVDFLNRPLPVYLFLPAASWEKIQPRLASPHRLLGRQRDLYANCDVVVVTNR